MLRYFRQTVRALLTDRTFSLTVALTLGVGIGANTAIFSVANALLNHPIDFPEQERLLSVLERKPLGTGTWSTASVANYLDWRQRSTSFTSMAAYAWWDANLTGAGAPISVKGFRVSPDFFKVLGVAAASGRVFTAQDMKAGDEQVVVLSHGLWQTLFQGSTKVLGSTIRLNGRVYQVLGVMPENFQFPAGGTELWVPLVVDPAARSDRTWRYLSVVGKLRPGVSVEGARADLDAIAAQLAREHPDANRGWGVQVLPLTDLVVGEIRPFVLLLIGVVAFVLLIACVNVSVLQIARSSSRRTEFATRISLGAPRWQIIRQLLTESVAVSLLGGLFAFFFGSVGLSLICSNMPAELAKYLPGWSGVRMDRAVFAFTLAVTVLCGLLCGLAPALRLSRADLGIGVKRAGRILSSGKRERRWREALVVVEVLLAVTLLIGTVAMADAFETLAEANRPFAPEHLLALHLVLPQNRYGDPQKSQDFYAELLARLAALPGVESAAAVNYMPFADLNASTFYTAEGEPRASAENQRNANFRAITPGLFETLRIPFKRGKDFAAFDGKGLPMVIVSSKLAEQCWPGQDPLGKRLRLGNSSAEPWLTVVGVVGDIRQGWLDKEIRPTLYVPVAQAPQLRMDVLVRTEGNPSALAASVRRIVSGLDREQPIKALRTMKQAIDDAMLGLRFVLVLLIVASGVALVLALVGIYSVFAHLARERSQEMGIRVALGATPAKILSLILLQTVRLTGLGIVMGLAAGTGLTRLLGSVMAGIQGLDPGTLSAALLLLLLSAVAASYFPARFVAATDPIIALRYE